MIPKNIDTMPTPQSEPSEDNDRGDLARYRSRILALPGIAALRERTVLLVGLGSVGSDIGARLCRLGVRVIGCDPDILVMENLVRWGLVVRPQDALGLTKAQVFRDALAAAIPGALVEGHAIDVVRQAAAFSALLRRTQPDLLIAATDTRDSRRAVNAVALQAQRPALFVGLSDGAASARIELMEPPGPCHLCAMAAEQPLELLRTSRTPYAVAEMDPVAVPALPVDIAIGAALATRLALLRLSGQEWRSYLHSGAQHGNVLFFSLRPDHWVFEEAWQRLIYDVERRPYCPACGSEEGAGG